MTRHERQRPSHGTRASIASAAARLMAEDGIADYGAAKRKAAKNLGATDNEALPGNEEIENELRAYLALYQDEEQTERLQELRIVALAAMDLLRDFRPYLTGSVLDGTAGRYAEVAIDVFADSAKDVEIMLLSRDINYDTDDIRHQTPGSPETRLRIEIDDVPVLISVFPLGAERIRKRNSHSGKQAERANADTVARLIENT